MISWYVRRSDQIRGPYTEVQFERYLLLGRIREGDEISVDGRHWEILRATHPRYPALLREADTPEGLARLKEVRARIDERREARQKSFTGGMHASHAGRRHDRRRGGDPFLEALERRVRDSVKEANRKRRWRRFIAWSSVMFILVGLAYASLLL